MTMGDVAHEREGISIRRKRWAHVTDDVASGTYHRPKMSFPRRRSTPFFCLARPNTVTVATTPLAKRGRMRNSFS